MCIAITIYITLYENEKERAPYIVSVEVEGFPQPIWDNRVDNQDYEEKIFNQGWRKSDPRETKFQQ